MEEKELEKECTCEECNHEDKSVEIITFRHPSGNIMIAEESEIPALEEQGLKYSKEPISLIEVGDFINGCWVKEIREVEDSTVREIVLESPKGEVVVSKDEDIKSFKGHEHFELLRKTLRVKEYKDFPKEGVVFKDLTPDMEDLQSFADRINLLLVTVPADVDYIVSPESRGFIYGSPVSLMLGKGFVPVRKEGKLPEEAVEKYTYTTEYSEDTLCIPKMTEYKDKKFFFIDDVYATGGTYEACKELINKVGGTLIGGAVVLSVGEVPADITVTNK